MKNAHVPLQAWMNGVQMAMILAEAQAVIAMRLLGMAGIWSVTGREDDVMVSEKLSAVSRSYGDSTRALVSGAGPDAVLAAALRPIRRKTRANARRLSKRGFKKG